MDELASFSMSGLVSLIFLSSSMAAECDMDREDRDGCAGKRVESGRYQAARKDSSAAGLPRGTTFPIPHAATKLGQKKVCAWPLLQMSPSCTDMGYIENIGEQR